jgi:heme oxygenase
MTTLKELTWDAHKRAEHTSIMHALLTDTISMNLYCDLIYTKYEIYRTIEDQVKFETPDLYRAQAAWTDWQSMACHMPRCMPSLDAYLAHVRLCDQTQIWGHVYVHYLAPLYGGQIIKKRIAHRLPVCVYEFSDAAAAIAEVRSHVTPDLATEANLAFEHVIEYYSDLWEQHTPS